MKLINFLEAANTSFGYLLVLGRLSGRNVEGGGRRDFVRVYALLDRKVVLTDTSWFSFNSPGSLAVHVTPCFLFQAVKRQPADLILPPGMSQP
jgi:hypothetical protein